MEIELVKIYDYNNPQDFLRDSYNEKKKANPAFSIRSWARNMAMDSHTPLQLVIQGKRKIPLSFIPKIKSSLNLNSKEADYFELLVHYNRAKKAEEKEHYHIKLQAVAPLSNVRFVEIENYKISENPLHTVLLELCVLKDFKNDLQWVKEKLNNKYSRLEIERAIERLVVAGLLIEKKGKLIKTNAHISTNPDITSKAVQNYHLQILNLAKEALNRDVNQREFGSYSLNIKRKNLKKAKIWLREMQKDFIEQFEAPEKKGDACIQFNTQLFIHTTEDEG